MTDWNVQSDEMFEELHTLITARIVEDITSEQLARLEHLVINHREARQIYLAYMQDTVVLRRMARANASNEREMSSRELDALRESLLAQRLHVDGEAGQSLKPADQWHQDLLELDLSDAGQSHDVDAVHASRPGWPLKHVIAAALIGVSVIGGVVALLLSSQESPPTPVAQLVESHFAQWQDEYERLVFLRDGKMLVNGRYSLADGLAKIRFGNGAVAVLDARERAVTIDLLDARRVFLHQGRMTVHVRNAGAKGFAVDLPCRRRIIDLGTEFGVVVDETGISDLYVMDGKVDAQLIDSNGSVVGHLEVAKHANVRLLETGSSVAHDPIHLGEFVSEKHFDQKREDAKLSAQTNSPSTTQNGNGRLSYAFPKLHRQNQPHRNYLDTNMRELIDGRVGATEYLDPNWVGWLDGPDQPGVFGPDSGRVQPRIEFDLGSPKRVTGVEFVYLVHPKGAVFAPNKLDVSLSSDPAFNQIVGFESGRDFDPDGTTIHIGKAKVQVTPVTARYLRLDFFNARQWTFIGEIKILTADDPNNKEQ